MNVLNLIQVIFIHVEHCHVDFVGNKYMLNDLKELDYGQKKLKISLF